MRRFRAVGPLLVVIGVLALILRGDATSARNVRLVGDLFATGRRPVQPTEWVAALALGAGAVLTLRGLGRRAERRRR